MFQKITPKIVRECIEDLEFYDINGFLPWEKKRIDITISGKALMKLQGKNKSKVIDKLVVDKFSGNNKYIN